MKNKLGFTSLIMAVAIPVTAASSEGPGQEEKRDDGLPRSAHQQVQAPLVVAPASAVGPKYNEDYGKGYQLPSLDSTMYGGGYTYMSEKMAAAFKRDSEKAARTNRLNPFK